MENYGPTTPPSRSRGESVDLQRAPRWRNASECSDQDHHSHPHAEREGKRRVRGKPAHANLHRQKEPPGDGHPEKKAYAELHERTPRDGEHDAAPLSTQQRRRCGGCFVVVFRPYVTAVSQRCQQWFLRRSSRRYQFAGRAMFVLWILVRVGTH